VFLGVVVADFLIEKPLQNSTGPVPTDKEIRNSGGSERDGMGPPSCGDAAAFSHLLTLLLLTLVVAEAVLLYCLSCITLCPFIVVGGLGEVCDMNGKGENPRGHH